MPQPLTIGTGRALLGNARMLAYTNKINALGPIAYWPMAEPSGSVANDESGNGRNGAYTGVTLGNVGVGDGRTAAGFDGATSFNNVLSAGLIAAFNTSQGSAFVWAKKTTAWNDAAFRELLNLTTGTASEMRIAKASTGNVTAQYNVGGVSKSVTIATGASLNVNQWYLFGLTWNKAGDQLIGYLGSAATAPATALGVPSGALTKALIGAKNIVAEVWLGFEAHAAIFDRVLAPAEIASAATL